MKYLLDTDWAINCMKGKHKVIEKIKEFRKDGLAVNIISLAEIYEGIFGSYNPRKYEDVFKEFLSGITILDITEDVCKQFGQLRNYLRKRGRLIGDFDLLIASTAKVNNLILLTDNAKHYTQVDGLKVASSDD